MLERGRLLAVGTAAVLLAAPATSEAVNGRIAYERSVGGDQEIFTINPDGSGELQLTDNGVSDTNPDYSHDGTRIVFERGFQIMVMNRDGSAQTALTNVSSTTSQDDAPEFSPDGMRIAFVRNGDLWVMDADGTDAVMLANHANLIRTPSFGHDGARVFFSIDNAVSGSGSEIYSVQSTVPTTAPVSLLSPASSFQEHQPTVAPDGSKVVFQGAQTGGDTDLWWAPPGGAASRTQLLARTSAQESPSFAPDSDRVVFREGSMMIAVTVANGAVQVIKDFGNASSFHQPSWGPDTAGGPDTIAPETTIESGPVGETTDDTPAFTFSSSEPAGATFRCRLSTGGTGTGEFFACDSGSYTSPALQPGAYLFEVKARDTAGNEDATPAARGFTVVTPGPAPTPVPTPAPRDTTPPETTITKGPRRLLLTRTAKVSFRSSESGSSFQCAVDSGRFAACASPHKFKKLKRGSRVLRVRAIDRAGNVDPTPAACRVKVGLSRKERRKAGRAKRCSGSVDVRGVAVPLT